MGTNACGNGWGRSGMRTAHAGMVGDDSKCLSPCSSLLPMSRHYARLAHGYRCKQRWWRHLGTCGKEA